jgi:hypothetical protein
MLWGLSPAAYLGSSRNTYCTCGSPTTPPCCSCIRQRLSMGTLYWPASSLSGQSMKLQRVTPTTWHRVGDSSASRSCMIQVLLTLETMCFSKPSILSTCSFTTNRYPDVSVHVTSAMERLNSGTATCCPRGRGSTSRIQCSPASPSRSFSRAMSRGLRASLPKMRLKTKSVFGSAKVGSIDPSYLRPRPLAMGLEGASRGKLPRYAIQLSPGSSPLPAGAVRAATLYSPLCDRGTDLSDCLALVPTAEELRAVLPWHQDANPECPAHVWATLEGLARRLGYGL